MKVILTLIIKTKNFISCLEENKPSELLRDMPKSFIMTNSVQLMALGLKSEPRFTGSREICEL